MVSRQKLRRSRVMTFLHSIKEPNMHTENRTRASGTALGQCNCHLTSVRGAEHLN